jgi:hypothetical protein
MLEIPKQYVLDEQQRTLAVQIPIAIYTQIEEILENLGLIKLIKEVENDERFSGNATYYQSLVEIVLKLAPEEQHLFQEKLDAQQKNRISQKDLAADRAEQFRQWLAQFPKSNVILPAEAFDRVDIYED